MFVIAGEGPFRPTYICEPCGPTPDEKIYDARVRGETTHWIPPQAVGSRADKSQKSARTTVGAYGKKLLQPECFKKAHDGQGGRVKTRSMKKKGEC